MEEEAAQCRQRVDEKHRKMKINTGLPVVGSRGVQSGSKNIFNAILHAVAQPMKAGN